MLPEISLNILDITQNSISAKASLVTIEVISSSKKETLLVKIEDDGCGMNEEQVQHVTDPFFTTRTTRKVGLGIPFFKQASEATGGEFTISSVPGEGTKVSALFHTNNIDCMPLGDINATMHELITMNTQVDFLYIRTTDKGSFTLDTREFKEILGGVPLDTPDVSIFIRDFLTENESSIN